VAFDSIFLLTIEPAPILAPFPIFIPEVIIALEPIITYSHMITSEFNTAPDPI